MIGLGQKNNKSEYFELLKRKGGYESTLPYLTDLYSMIFLLSKGLLIQQIYLLLVSIIVNNI